MNERRRGIGLWWEERGTVCQAGQCHGRRRNIPRWSDRGTTHQPGQCHKRRRKSQRINLAILPQLTVKHAW